MKKQYVEPAMSIEIFWDPIHTDDFNARPKQSGELQGFFDEEEE